MPCSQPSKMIYERGVVKGVAVFVNNANALLRFPRGVFLKTDDRYTGSVLELVLSSNGGVWIMDGRCGRSPLGEGRARPNDPDREYLQGHLISNLFPSRSREGGKDPHSTR